MLKIRGKTPLTSSLCPYCHNISLKCKKVGSTDVKTEYELFDYLTCKTTDGHWTKPSCLKNECEECNNWEEKLDALLSCVSKEEEDEFSWYSWQIKQYDRPNGK